MARQIRMLRVKRNELIIISDSLSVYVLHSRRTDLFYEKNKFVIVMQFHIKAAQSNGNEIYLQLLPPKN